MNLNRLMASPYAKKAYGTESFGFRFSLIMYYVH